MKVEQDPLKKLLEKRLTKPKPIINIHNTNNLDRETFFNFIKNFSQLVKDDYYVISYFKDSIDVYNGDKIYDLDEISAKDFLENYINLTSK